MSGATICRVVAEMALWTRGDFYLQEDAAMGAGVIAYRCSDDGQRNMSVQTASYVDVAEPNGEGLERDRPYDFVLVTQEPGNPDLDMRRLDEAMRARDVFGDFINTLRDRVNALPTEFPRQDTLS